MNFLDQTTNGFEITPLHLSFLKDSQTMPEVSQGSLIPITVEDE